MNKSILLFLFFLVAISSVGKAQEVSYTTLTNYEYVSYYKASNEFRNPYSINYNACTINEHTKFIISDGKISLQTGETTTEITKDENLDESKYTILAPIKASEEDEEEWYMWECYAASGSYYFLNYASIKNGDNIHEVIQNNKDKFSHIIAGSFGYFLLFGKQACTNQIRFQKNPVYMIKNKEQVRAFCDWDESSYISFEDGKKTIGDYLSEFNLGNIPNTGYNVPEGKANKYYAFAIPYSNWEKGYFWKLYKNIFHTLAVEVTQDTEINNELLIQLGVSEEGCQIAIGRYIEPGQWTIPIHYGEGDEEAFTFSSDMITYPQFNRDGATFDCFMVEEYNSEESEWQESYSWSEIYLTATDPQIPLDGSSLGSMIRIVPKENHDINEGFCNQCRRHIIGSVEDWEKLWYYNIPEDKWYFTPKDFSIVISKDIAFKPSESYEHPLFDTFNVSEGFPVLIDGQNHVISNFHTTTTLFSYYINDNGDLDIYAQISNLNIVDFAINYNSPYNDNKYVNYDTREVLIPIISEYNSAIIKDCTFRGSLHYCDAYNDIFDGYSITSCLIAYNKNTDAIAYYPTKNGTLSHILYYNDDEGDDANKATYIVKQTIGVGRSDGKGTVKKVAVQKKEANKAVSLKDIVYDKDSKDLNDDLRYFTDEQLASGEVAYWLNYEGKGYTGDFTRTWTQGSEVPEMTTPDSNNATHQLTYKVANGSNNVTDVTPYANEGSAVRISLSKDPESVTVDGTPAILSSDSEDNIFYADFNTPVSNNGEVEVEIVYEAGTGIKNETADNECNVREENGEISADCDFQIFSLMGQDVTSLNGKLSKGIYLVKCAAGTTTKVIVK